MKIKRDSTLYKFYDRMDLSTPNNLCWLFWKTVIVVALCVGVGVGLAFLAVCYLLGPIFLYQFGFLDDGSWVSFCQIFFMSTTSLVGGAVVIFGTGKLLHTVSGRVRRSENLALEYVRAKKQKICPIVEWE